MANSFSFKICAECGRQFIPAASSMYKLRIKDRVRHYCSYTCYTKAKNRKQSKKDLTRHGVKWYNDKEGGEQ
jgi:hypothetical protein